MDGAGTEQSGERRGELPAAGTAQQVALNWFGLGNIYSVPCVPEGPSGEPRRSSGRGFLCRTSHLLERHQLHLQPKAFPCVFHGV